MTKLTLPMRSNELEIGQDGSHQPLTSLSPVQWFSAKMILSLGMLARYAGLCASGKGRAGMLREFRGQRPRCY